MKIVDSDDAVGPHFPSHVLGSRDDPGVHSLGIYGNKLRLSRSTSPPKQLDPIQEANSFVSINTVKPVIYGHCCFRTTTFLVRPLQ